jgi:hypothetical protein
MTETPYDWAEPPDDSHWLHEMIEEIDEEIREHDGKFYAGVHAVFEDLEGAIRWSHAAEDLVNKMNGEFQDSEIEPQ